MIWSSVNSLCHHGGGGGWSYIHVFERLAVCLATSISASYQALLAGDRGCTTGGLRLQLPQLKKSKTPFPMEGCFTERMSSSSVITPHPAYFSYVSVELAGGRASRW